MSQTTPTTPNINSLESLSGLLSKQMSQTKTRRIPPLEKWSPSNCGEMDLVIKANGEWWHEGRKMTRQSMIDLFASVLWCEKSNDKSACNEGDYFLKTPIEKIAIQVEDVPLFVNQVEQITALNGVSSLVFSTTTGDVITADSSHPLRIRTALDNPNEQRLYLKVRQNGDSVLYGLIQRHVWLHLIGMGELRENVADNTVVLRLSSEGQNFELAMPNV